MSEEAKKDYDNEMRGSLWSEENRTNDKAPTATGTVTISGVELRLAMWPARVAGGSGKGAGKKYWPISVEYKQGTKFMLAKISPANVLVTGATAEAAAAEAPGDDKPVDVGDMPF